MEQIDLSNLTVLLLEDVETDAELVKRLLIKNNLAFTFRHITWFPDFINALQEVKPDVILSDYQLQGNTGLDALNYCIESGYNKPFIFVTSSENESIAVECLKTGAFDYILKDKLFMLPSAIEKAVAKYNTNFEMTQTRHALENRERLLAAIAEVSKILLADITIEDALYKLVRIIGQASGQDRTYIFERTRQSDTTYPLFSQTYEWVKEGVSSEIDNPNLQNINLNDFSTDILENLKENKLVNAVIREIPQTLLPLFISQNIFSVLLVPINVNNELWGFIGLDNCRFEYRWNDTDLDAFMTVGSLIENFILRYQNELTLRENEEKYRLLAENALDVIWTMDLSGKYLYVSPSIISLRGVTPDEYLNESIEDSLAPGSAEFARQLFKEMKPLIEKGERPGPLTLVLEQNCKWGGTIWTEVIVSGVYNKKGEFSHILGVTRDITKRKKAEDELSASRNLFESLTTVSPVGVFRTDPDGYTTYVNPRWQELSGISDVEALGNGWMVAVHPDDLEKVKKHWGETSTSNSKAELEYRFRHKNGRIVWVIGNVVPEFEKGKIKGFIGTITDLTSRRLSEKALRESEERFRNSITHAPIPVMIHSERKILQLSDSFIATTGIKPDELKNIDQWYEMAARIEDSYNPEGLLLKNAHYPIIEGTWRVFSRKTIPRIWEFNSSLIGTYNETQEVYISMAMDVTNKKQMEEELYKSRLELNAIFHGAPILMFLLNNRREIIKVNQTALHYTGKNRQDILEKRLGAALSCKYCTDGDECMRNEFCNQCKFTAMTDSIFVANKKSITVEDLEMPISFQGKIQERIFYTHAEILFSDPEEKVLFTMLDITERINSAKELKVSEEKFRNLIANAPVGIALVSSEGKIVEVNRGALKIFGYDYHEEMIGINAEEFYFDKMERTHFITKLKADQAKGLETQMVDRFGNQIWIMETAVTHIFPDGDTGHLSILEDISQRKESEAKIRAYQENLQEMIKARTHELENSNRELGKLFKAVEHSPSTVIITDRMGNIEYVNPKFCEITGYSFEEVIGNNPRMVKSNDTPKEYYQQMWETISAGKTWTGQFKNKKKDGSLFWELCSIAPIFDINNEITHYVGVKQDITEKMLAEEQLRNYTRELEIFNKTMVDRELRMIEMKEEVNQLCRSLGIPEKYSTNWEM